MARLSVIQRELKRAATVEKYADKRSVLKELILSPSSTDEQKWNAQFALQKLPRDSSPVRKRNRCQLTGRPHGYYRKFGLARNKLREHAMKGDIPGLVKASW